jgi:HAD superfamily hydrolase (TIGR01490 family)
MQNLAIFDVDNTIINGQSQKILLDYLYKKGIIPFYKYISILSLFYLYKVNLISNPSRIMSYAYSFLKNKSDYDINLIINDFFSTELKKRFYDSIVKLINKHQEQGDRIILLSNSTNIIISKIAEHLGVNEFISSKLEIKNKTFSGRIEGEIVYGINKYKLILKYLGINDSTTNKIKAYFYTDHISDLPLLLNVSNPITVNPDNELLNIAKKNSWDILEVK